MDVATQGGNVPAAAQAVAQQGNRIVTAMAADSVNARTGGLLADVGKVAASGISDVAHAGDVILGQHLAHYAGDAIGDVAKAANTPLTVVQHEYRYLHDVEARHGFTEALLEGLGMTAAVAAGTLLTGGLGDVAMAGFGATADVAAGAAEGAVGEAAAGTAETAVEGEGTGEAAAQTAKAGGDALTKGPSVMNRLLNASGGRAAVLNTPVGPVAGQLWHQDSWERTANGNAYRDPHTGLQVSFGRDIAGGFFHFNKDSGAYTAASGLSDALGDIFGDPLQGGLQQVTMARSLEGGSILNKTYSGNVLTNDGILRTMDPDIPGGAMARAWVDKTAVSTGADIIAADPRLDPIVWDKTVASSPDDQDDLASAMAALAETRRKARFARRVVTEHASGELSQPVRTHLANVEYAGNLNAGESGVAAHISTLRNQTIPDLEQEVVDHQHTIDAIPKKTLLGLDSAKTADEVLDVLHNRIVTGQESVGSAIPTRSWIKDSAAKVR
ncbi:MAG TPA: hypothetical protein VMQ59_12940, partial [Acidimicrobiales bacterium]|nr:hypothetical protein [Acidimicrobiales bacterium]